MTNSAKEKTAYFKLPSKRKSRKYPSQKDIPRPHTFHRKPDTVAESPLISALWNKMNEKGISPKEAAEDYLGITYAYLTALARGDRLTNKLTWETLERMSLFLDVPKAQVMLLAGILAQEDFYYRGSIPERMARLYQRMIHDPVWGGYMPNKVQWDALHPQVQLLIGGLYEHKAPAMVTQTVAAALKDNNQQETPAQKQAAAG